jgi:hypothetical protein
MRVDFGAAVDIVVEFVGRTLWPPHQGDGVVICFITGGLPKKGVRH